MRRFFKTVLVLGGLLLVTLPATLPSRAAAADASPLGVQAARRAAARAERAAVSAAERAREASHVFNQTLLWTRRYGASVGCWVGPARRAGLYWDEIPALMRTLKRRRAERASAIVARFTRVARLRIAVVRYAKQFLGVPYVWGGASPSGFDCSGLTMYVYRHFGVALYHGATMQERQGRHVTRLRPGDLVFFGGGGYYHHVGLYAGDGMFIEAPHSGAVVTLSPLRGYATASRYDLAGAE